MRWCLGFQAVKIYDYSLLTYDTLQSSRQLPIFLHYFQIQGEDGSSMCLLKHWLTTYQTVFIIAQKTTV